MKTKLINKQQLEEFLVELFGDGKFSHFNSTKIVSEKNDLSFSTKQICS